jgi:hypothetical protein
VHLFNFVLATIRWQAIVMTSRRLSLFRQSWRNFQALQDVRPITTSAPCLIKTYDEEHLRWKKKPRNQYSRLYSLNSDAPKGWSVIFFGFLTFGMIFNFMGYPKQLLDWFTDTAIERGERDRKKKLGASAGGTSAASKAGEGSQNAREA